MSERELKIKADFEWQKFAILVKTNPSLEEIMAKKWRAMAMKTSRGGKKWLK